MGSLRLWATAASWRLRITQAIAVGSLPRMSGTYQPDISLTCLIPPAGGRPRMASISRLSTKGSATCCSGFSTLKLTRDIAGAFPLRGTLRGAPANASFGHEKRSPLSSGHSGARELGNALLGVFASKRGAKLTSLRLRITAQSVSCAFCENSYLQTHIDKLISTNASKNASKNAF